jgi:uncharacterized membrane protein YdjX (TVP38/TMEM64 family)
MNQKPAAQKAASPQQVKPAWRGMLLLACLAIILFAGIYLSPLRQYLGRVRELSDQLRTLGWGAPLVFSVAVAVLVALGLPRLFFCVLGGMALGFWQGLLWAQLGTLLGNYVVFSLARSWAREWARGYLSRHGKLQILLAQEGIASVILARQLPLPGLLINLTCGFLSLGCRDFLLGTLLGQLPEAVPCTLIGAGVLQSSFRQSLGLIGLGVASAVVIWIVLRRLLLSSRKR